MRYLSICSGIEAASVAWHPLGWQAQAFAEIEPFPSAVLAHHYPSVPNLGDVTRFQDWPDAAFDVLVGGTPCQSFSVAGLRAGLDDPRGSLMLVYLAMARRFRPRWLVWENVPGVLSSDDGRAFGSLLGGLAELGYGFAYRVLDAQYFNLAQRRARVFVVGYLGDWRRAAAVLFERASLSGHPAPSREAGQIAPTIPSRSLGGGGLGTDFDCDGGLIPTPILDGAKGRTDKRGSRDGSAMGKPGDPMFTLRRDSSHAVALPMVPHVAPCLTGNYGKQPDSSDTSAGPMLVPIAMNLRGRDGGAMPELSDLASIRAASGGSSRSYIAFSAKDHGADAGDISPTLRAGGHCGSHANGGVMPAVAFTNQWGDENADVFSTLKADCNGALPMVAFQSRGSNIGVGDVSGTIGSNSDRASGGAPMVAQAETLYNQGINHASTQKTHTGTLLRTLSEAVGTEAFTQWGLGILDSLLPSEVLRSRLHGCGVRLAADFSRRWLVYHALARPEAHSEGLVQAMREAEREGRASQGWRPPEQLARELGAYLSQLSQPGPQAQRFMLDLWQAAEGVGLLREALSAVQEVGRSAGSERQPVRLVATGNGSEPAEGVCGGGMSEAVSRERVLRDARATGKAADIGQATENQERSSSNTMAVRRLTVEECEFLQGFPRGYTAIPYRGKPAADGPRYKALGNSMAVPVMAWIGRRIQLVDEL